MSNFGECHFSSMIFSNWLIPGKWWIFIHFCCPTYLVCLSFWPESISLMRKVGLNWLVNWLVSAYFSPRCHLWPRAAEKASPQGTWENITWTWMNEFCVSCSSFSPSSFARPECVYVAFLAVLFCARESGKLWPGPGYHLDLVQMFLYFPVLWIWILLSFLIMTEIDCGRQVMGPKDGLFSDPWNLGVCYQKAKGTLQMWLNVWNSK